MALQYCVGFCHTTTWISQRYTYVWASLVAQTVKNLPAMQKTQVWSLGVEDPQEKGRAAYSIILSWRNPWTEESIELQWVGHDWATNSIQMSPPSWAFLPLPNPSHPSRLSQSTGIELPESYGKCPLLSILHTVANNFQHYSLNSSLPLFRPLCPQVCFLCRVSIAALQIRSSVPSF